MGSVSRELFRGRCTRASLRGHAQCPVNENEVHITKRERDPAAGDSRHQAPCNNKEVKRTRGQETRTSFLLLRKVIPAPEGDAAGPPSIDR